GFGKADASRKVQWSIPGRRNVRARRDTATATFPFACPTFLRNGLYVRILDPGTRVTSKAVAVSCLTIRSNMGRRWLSNRRPNAEPDERFLEGLQNRPDKRRGVGVARRSGRGRSKSPIHREPGASDTCCFRAVVFAVRRNFGLGQPT